MSALPVAAPSALPTPAGEAPTSFDAEELQRQLDLMLADEVSRDAGETRTALLSSGPGRQGSEVLALGVDAALALKTNDPLQAMLAHQMALAHRLTFGLTNEAAEQREPVEKARLINAAARMMAAFQQAMLVLHRVRTGGSQTVTVLHQYVNVNGQALVQQGLQAGGSHAALPGAGQ